MGEKITFKVIGDRTIHCKGCETSISMALKFLPEVRDVSADRKSQMIEVILADGDSQEDKLISELDWLGYQVELV